MIKTKIFSYLKDHKYRTSLYLFLVILLPCLVLLPQFAQAGPLAGVLIGNLTEFFVKAIAAIGYSLVVMGLTMVNLGMEVSGSFIEAILKDTGAGSVTSLIAALRASALTFLGIIVIIVAFAQVLHIKIDQWGAKAVLPKLFLASFLSLFSTLICTVIYDFGTLVTTAIAAPAQTTVGDSTAQIAKKFAEIRDLFTTNTDLKTNIFAVVIFLILCLLIFLGYIIISLILFFRTIMILILIILAPLAFIAMVLPWTSGLYKKWWSEYAKWVFYLPAAFLFLYLSGMITSAIIVAVNDPATKVSIDDILTNGQMGQDVMLKIGQLFIPAVSAFVLTIAAIFLPFRLLGKAGSIASSLTKKAGRSAWQASPGGTAQNMWKQASSNRATMRQSQAGKRLASLQRKVTGEVGEDGRPANPYRAWAAQKATGRDSLALGREVDKNISDVKNAGGTTPQMMEYLKRVELERNNGTKKPEKAALSGMDYNFQQAMKGFDTEMQIKVAKTAIRKDERATLKIGALKKAVAISKPGATDADIEKSVIDSLGDLNRDDAGSIKAEHLQDLVERFGQDGAKKIILQAWKPEKIKVMMAGAKEDTSAELSTILGKDSPDYVPPPEPVAPPEPSMYHDPTNNPYTQPLPGNDEEEKTRRNMRF